MKNTNTHPMTSDQFELVPEIVRDLDVDSATGQNVKGQTLRRTTSK